MSYRDSYKFGKSTLQGGSSTSNIDVSQVQKIAQQVVVESATPDFDASTDNCPLRFVNFAENEYGRTVNKIGNVDVETFDYGTAVFFNKINRDPLNLMADTPDVSPWLRPPVYFEIRCNNLYGYFNGQPFDYRTGYFRIGCRIDMELNPLGNRTATIVATVYDGNATSWAEILPIWSQNLPATGQGAQLLQIESIDVEINLLELRRVAIKKFSEMTVDALGHPVSYDVSNPVIAVGFNIYQTSGKYLEVYDARIWFKRTRNLSYIDPDTFIGIPA